MSATPNRMNFFFSQSCHLQCIVTVIRFAESIAFSNPQSTDSVAFRLKAGCGCVPIGSLVRNSISKNSMNVDSEANDRWWEESDLYYCLGNLPESDSDSARSYATGSSRRETWFPHRKFVPNTLSLPAIIDERMFATTTVSKLAWTVSIIITRRASFIIAVDVSKCYAIFVSASINSVVMKMNQGWR